MENNNLLDLDLTEIPGTDNLHKGNGSTCGVLSTIYQLLIKMIKY